jgi:hypothetical protein
MQRELLLAEGIAVAPDGRLPLARHRWRPDPGFDLMGQDRGFRG